ncbi:hypothetical protein A9264_14205 [Vibrio sp. UCD-FRSSP16_10]|uniref:BatD family protein n=1 Tax=unclassified Vibrio TaxID=2614977 RepID=UPI000800F5C4|nr:MULTISPECIES: BatD family protein [unclassified Vibrio]OBT13260.1 hypothetical protein A9260_14585 [Vibrio sp. UCD-FRSSP16_30]OBT19610.1 hypothetical protein A9264_14205 [Vibrio sp. UCD-FRSSP16_10]
MMNRLWYCAALALAVVALSFSSLSYASDMLALQRSGDIKIKTWLEKQNEGEQNVNTRLETSVNQPVTLYIELSTPRWFTAGTRITLPEIPNVIVKQRSQLAVNYAERRNGQTWSVQLWQINLFAQNVGSFVVPPVAVNAQVSVDSRHNVAGTLYSKALKFNASLPSGRLTQDLPWINSPNVEISQDWQQSSDALKAGDVITRTLVVTASDTLSVLLPPMLVPTVLNEPNQGQVTANNRATATQSYQVYSKPVQLFDEQTRTQYHAKRVEEQVYVLQHGGEVHFADYSVLWWNSNTEKLQKLTFKGNTFKVAHTLSSWLNYYKGYLLAVLISISSLLAISWFIWRYYQTRPRPSWWHFACVLSQGHNSEVRSALYLHLRTKSGHLQMGALSSSDEWQALAKVIQAPTTCFHSIGGFFRGWILWLQISLLSQRQYSRLSCGGLPCHGSIRYLWHRYRDRALPQLDEINLRYQSVKFHAAKFHVLKLQKHKFQKHKSQIKDK